MNRYEHVYDVGLLDDLHNYFPGLLYESESFRTVQDVLLYIRTTTARRFNLYENGRQSYARSRPIPQNTINTPLRTVPIRPVRTVPIVETWSDALFSDDVAIFSLLRSLDRIVGTTPNNLHQNNFQDIIVHASQELINTASTSRELLFDLEERCSICQDRMRQGENIRKINACRHEFHGECVDNWFLHRSVLCPVCRHDIRNNEVRRSPLIMATNGPVPPPAL
jgi:Ring finger domain